jgi:hypothetical protein
MRDAGVLSAGDASVMMLAQPRGRGAHPGDVASKVQNGAGHDVAREMLELRRVAGCRSGAATVRPDCCWKAMLISRSGTREQSKMPGHGTQALLLAGQNKVRDLFVEGRQIVRDGADQTIDTSQVIKRQNVALALRLAQYYSREVQPLHRRPHCS